MNVVGATIEDSPRYKNENRSPVCWPRPPFAAGLTSALAAHLLWVVLVLASPAAAGEVFTWTDADGNIHITDRPPADSSTIDSVIRYSNPAEPETRPGHDAAPPPDSVAMQAAEQLKRQLKRLDERKTQLEKSIADNQAGISDAQQDAAYYRKRSGSYARRNEKSIERQLVVLNNNLTTYLSDLRYVEEDIVETEKRLADIEQRLKRPGGEPGAFTSEN